MRTGRHKAQGFSAPRYCTDLPLRVVDHLQRDLGGHCDVISEGIFLPNLSGACQVPFELICPTAWPRWHRDQVPAKRKRKIARRADQEGHFLFRIVPLDLLTERDRRLRVFAGGKQYQRGWENCGLAASGSMASPPTASQASGRHVSIWRCTTPHRPQGEPSCRASRFRGPWDTSLSSHFFRMAGLIASRKEPVQFSPAAVAESGIFDREPWHSVVLYRGGRAPNLGN